MNTYQLITARAASAAICITGVALLSVAFAWPQWATELFKLRTAVTFIGLWCYFAVLLLHPDLNDGLRRGVREFRKALVQVAKEMRGDDDDDDPPLAA